MTLTKNQKVLLGIAHFLPFIGIVAYIICIFSFVFGTIATQQSNTSQALPAEFFAGMIGAVSIFLISILVSIGVKIIDIIHLVKNNKGDTGNKVLLWILLFFFAGTFAEIIYFFVEVVPEKKQESKNLIQTESE